MERHDEMKQLSLIPMNASLFAALLKGEDSASINTTTKLYQELTLYLIRRELSRMGHKAWNELTELYITSTAMIYETNSISIPLWFANFNQCLPNPIYLYIHRTVSPNDWICFTQSLWPCCRYSTNSYIHYTDNKINVNILYY